MGKNLRGVIRVIAGPPASYLFSDLYCSLLCYEGLRVSRASGHIQDVEKRSGCHNKMAAMRAGPAHP